MSNEHTPTTDLVRSVYIQHMTRHGDIPVRQVNEEFDRFLAAAEQRGAKRAFRKTQEIIAGFEHTIDEARNRDDMINTGYLIQKIDTEIQDLMEDDDETH